MHAAWALAIVSAPVIACDKRKRLRKGAKRRSNPCFNMQRHGLLRFARNDGEGASLLRRHRAARRSTQRRQQARHQTAALGETVNLDMFVERMSVGATNTQAIEGGDTHGARKIAVGAAAGAAMR